ncbi:MAG: hypothetical protein WCO45_10205 [Pseudanabaena sp. ELA607]
MSSASALVMMKPSRPFPNFGKSNSAKTAAIKQLLQDYLVQAGITNLDLTIECIDSILKLNILANHAIDQAKLVAIIDRTVQTLPLESIAKVKIYGWRKDEEFHEQRLFWTETIMLNPKSISPSAETSTTNEAANAIPPEEILSKPNVLHQAMELLADSDPQFAQAVVPPLDAPPAAPPQPIAPPTTGLSQHLGQLFFLGMSIMLLGLSVGIFVRLLSSVHSYTNTVAPTSAPLPASPPPIADPLPTNRISPATTTKITPKTEINLSVFEQIQEDMTLAQVEKIIGSSGKLIAETKTGGIVGQVYSWKNPQGSNAIIEFRNGKVIAKAQAGLE